MMCIPGCYYCRWLPYSGPLPRTSAAPIWGPHLWLTNLPEEREEDKLHVARLTHSCIAELEAKHNHFACTPKRIFPSTLAAERQHRWLRGPWLELHESRLLLLRSMCTTDETVEISERK